MNSEEKKGARISAAPPDVYRLFLFFLFIYLSRTKIDQPLSLEGMR
jgi:hypothetical protein